MKLSLFIFLGITRGAFIGKDEATGFLKSRTRRANSWHSWEETKDGNLERECIEETCDDEELFEVYDNQELFQVEKRQMDRCQKILEKIDEYAQKFNTDDEENGIDSEAEKNILRKCLVTQESDVALLAEGMRVSMSDADFRKWVGECLSTFANGVAGTTQELLGKISEGLKEIDWERFVTDAKDFGAQVINGIREFGSDN
ncbi:Oidioi.mRNA.OKI2018_I69.chr2.g5381.t1.cds [Oikopleura dioica]|uniref:Oidioi.mRNA.OKI2018_I69.chr2.g5381.t1.cds n=1 Tax=Oikopleura dioica TaxID=34765 RepID=A0ABN7SZR0_OIKDI|nr:Oidioi.mRNA.OKI2018_I69.chr2.g5381.t1.cds [Oikopleura dioica]